MAEHLLNALRAHRYALLVAGGYLVFGVAWVLGSDYVIATLSDDAMLLSRLQSAKGSVFIVASAVAIYFVIRLQGQPEASAVDVAAMSGERQPLRMQLLLLTAATTLPLIALLAYNVQREARRAIDNAAESAQNLARVIATDAARSVRDARVLAEGLAERPAVRALDAERCDTQLAETTRLVPHVANAVTVRSDGALVCSALARDTPTSFAQFPLFQRVIQTGRSDVGRLTRGPISQRHVAPVAAPLRNAEGALVGTIVLSLDVARLAPAIATPADDGRVVTLIDGAGNVLMSVPDGGSIGTDASQSDVTRLALKSGEGRGRARTPQGSDTIFGFARVDGADWIAIATVPARTVLRASRESASRSAVFGAVIVLATLVVAYLAGRRIERPLRAIASTARSVAEGDLSARAPVAGSLEAADIAGQLNRLLDRLPQIESRLRDSERRLSLVLRAAQEGIVVTDVARTVTFANDAAARLLGVPDAEELVGQSLAALLAPAPASNPQDARAAVERPIDRADRFELNVRARDGVDRWLFVSATPLRGDTGNVEGALAMLYDVTERKEVEERLARVTRLYWALSEVNEAIVRTTDRQALFEETCRVVVQEGDFVGAVVLMLDDTQAALFAAASAGVDIRTPVTLDADSAAGATAAALRTGQPAIVNAVDAVERALLPHGVDAEAIRALAVLPLRCEGRIVGTLNVYATQADYFDIGLTELLRQVADDVSFALDVYERAAARDRAEEQVRHVNAELERRVAERTARLTEANQELESFSYSVSHDLRAPVRAVNGFAQILRDHAGAALDDEGRRLVGNIIRASAHMGRLIDDLLALAQLGRSAIDLEPVDPEPIVERIVESLRTIIADTGAEVVVRPLPTALGDATLLHQVFANLIGNALEYRRPDVAPRIEVDARHVDGRVEFVVRDNGIGIAPEHHARIFEPFIRLHPTGARPGTGIGLALVAKAVGLMRGDIAVESSEGHGATFRVTLPAPNGRADPSPAPSADAG